MKIEISMSHIFDSQTRSRIRDRAYVTKHARERMTARSIPPGLADMIIDYGERTAAHEGTVKFALGKDGIRQIKREFGPQIAKALQPFRNAYVVVGDGRTITVAFSKRSIAR